MPFTGPLKGGENAAYLVPEALREKNVAGLLSDRSRALAQAYVLKRQDDILYWKTQNKLMQHSSFSVRKLLNYGFLVK